MANASVQDFKRRLARIPPRVRAAAMAALVKNAEKMVAGMKSAVPKDKSVLAASIRLSVDLANTGVTIEAGGPSTTKPVRDGADASYDYALAQELGTEKMPANPFFWPSYRLHRKSMRASVKRAMSKAVKAEALGGSGD